MCQGIYYKHGQPFIYVHMYAWINIWKIVTESEFFLLLSILTVDFGFFFFVDNDLRSQVQISCEISALFMCIYIHMCKNLHICIYR